MPKFGIGPSRRRKGSNNGWRRPAKTPSKDRTRAPSPTIVAGFYQEFTPPTLDVNMTDRLVDPCEGPPEDLDPAGGVWPAAGNSVRDMARHMWNTCYGEEYVKEFNLYSQSGLLNIATQMMLHTPASSWQRQGRSGEVNAARRKDKELTLLMRRCAEAAYERNHGDIPFSIASRSVQHLGHKSSSTSWTETASVLAKSTATVLVNAMVSVRPLCSLLQAEPARLCVLL